MSNRYLIPVFLIFFLTEGGELFAGNRISYLSAEDGLSHNTVNVIHKDRYGFMWFGTNHGLNKYDGYSFQIYQNMPGTNNSLSNNRVYSIMEDDNGQLWIGTGNGLNRYNREKDSFRQYYLIDQAGEPLVTFVNNISAYNNHGILIGTIGNGLHMFDPDAEQFVALNSQSAEFPENGAGDDVYSVIVDSRNRIWFANKAHGINLLREDNGQVDFFPFFCRNGFLDNIGKTIYEDIFGNIWVCTEGRGLFRLVEPENDFIHYHTGSDNYLLSNNIVKDIRQGKDRLYYVATDGGGVNVLDLANRKVEFIRYDLREHNSLSSDGIYSLYIDDNGICWIGTFGTGINIIDPNVKPFKHVTHTGRSPDELSHPVLWGFCEDENGNIWIGTDGGGVNIYNPERNKFYHYQYEPGNRHSLGSNVVIDIFKDSQQRIWVGTFGGGLNHYEPRTKGFIRYTHNPLDPRSINSNDVWSVYEDRQGRHWVGTLGGLNLFDPETGKFTEIEVDVPETDLKFSKKVARIVEDRYGNIWLGGAWLGIMDKDSFEIRVFSNESIQGFEIGDILVDKNQRIWIATEGGGLGRYDEDTDDFIMRTMADGLPSNTLFRILEDDNGMMWISTSRGISMFDPERNTFRNYDRYDGLQGNQFSAKSALQSQSGKLYFGGLNGFTAFYPDSIQDNQTIPAVVITGMSVMNQPIPSGGDGVILDKNIIFADKVVLKHSQNIFQIEFAALNYTVPEKNSYAFMMEGFDQDWYYSGTSRNATYTNLRPGSYVFRVKASNNDGVWNEEGTSIKIRVMPPWWRTTWAYVTYGLLFAVILYYIREYSRRQSNLKNELLLKDVEKKKAEELNQLKLKFYTNISHEFRTPLTLIISPLERLIETVSPDSAVGLQLKVIHKNTVRLSKLINQVMDFRTLETGKIKYKPYWGDLVAFVKEIHDAFQQAAKENEIQFRFISPEKEIVTWFDKEKMDVIVYNLLSNAFKFTPAKGSISLHIYPAEPAKQRDSLNKNKRIHIIVKDTGIGIPASDLKKVFDRFYQVNDRSRPSKSMEQQGTGIGLSLTKEFVELHKGTISVASEHGKGSEFLIDLPLYLREDGKDTVSEDESSLSFDTPTDKDNHGEGGRPAEHVKRNQHVILVVEDHEDMRMFIKDTLQPDFNVLMAENGVEGLHIASAEIPDLIISDVMMPGMDGFEMARLLKSKEQTSHIPVVFLSAINTVESNLYGLKLGAEDYIEKPFNANVMLAKVNNLISNRSRLQEKLRRELLLQPKEKLIESPEERFLAKTIDIIEKNMSNPEFDVRMFYTEMGMSRSVLYRKLEAITGQSANELVRSIRMKRAADLLKTGSLSISEICYEVGFNDPQYFSRCFKNIYGLSPSRFAREGKSDNLKRCES